MLVIGCPIKDRAWAVPWWWAGIRLQIQEDIKVVALLTPSEDETESLLKDLNVEIIYDDEVGRSVNEINGHHWNGPHYEYMARLRNRLVEAVMDMRADYFFSLDSDIYLPSDALTRLIPKLEHYGGVIAPAVNMAQQTTAWNTMSWNGPHGLVHRPHSPFPGRADVIMAAMLMDRRGMECRWASHIAGEDIGFCIDAERKGVPRWWLPEVRCTHLMQPQPYRNE